MNSIVRWPMRIWLHLTLQILGEFAAFFLGILLVWVLMPADFRAALGPIFCLALLGGGGAAGALGMRWLVRRVGARCPCCGGRAVSQDIRPISYRCKACGHTHSTRVRSNW